MKISPHVFAFIPVVRQSQRPKEALDALRQKGITDVSLENRLEVRNQGNGEHEIVLIGAVGGSWWDESGITESEFRNALKEIPKGSRITLLINSEGGSVQEGLGIYNAIKERSAEITAKISGYAVSIASVFPLAASKVISPKSAIWMTHKAWSYAQGNDEDFDRAAQMLREHNDTLVDIYVAETGKTEDEWKGWMKAETWIRGAKAIEFGLADETEESDESQASYRPFHPDFIQRCKNISPEILNVISALPPQGERKQTDKNNTDTTMNRAQKIALLNGWGVMVKDEASLTDARIDELIAIGKTSALAAFKGEAAPVAAVAQPAGVPITKADVDNAVATAVQAAEKRAEVKATLAQLVTDRRITQAQADKWLPTALKDDSVLAALRENPVMPEAAAPVAMESEISVDASPKETVLAIARFDEPVKAWQRGNDSITPEQISNASRQRAEFIKKHASKIMPVMNANTIPAGLKRSVIMQTLVEDFARKVLRLDAFAMKVDNVKLLGDNKVQVPYYDLDSSASTSFVSGTGYTTIGNTATAVKEITVGEGAPNGDRLYQALSFSSQEFARQPFLNIMQLAKLKAQKLASDIVTDVLGIITIANFPVTAKTEDADTFDSDDVIDIKLACKMWDEDGRFLYLDSAYDANLLKDPAFKAAYAAASDRAIKEGKLNPRVFGFDYVENPTIPENGEKLVGFATFKGAAIGVAFAPVPPVEEVRNAGTTYEIYTDPISGLMLEYRTFGNVTTDAAVHVIESSYGFAVLNATALKAVRRP